MPIFLSCMFYNCACVRVYMSIELFTYLHFAFLSETEYIDHHKYLLLVFWFFFNETLLFCILSGSDFVSGKCI